MVAAHPRRWRPTAEELRTVAESATISLMRCPRTITTTVPLAPATMAATTLGPATLAAITPTSEVAITTMAIEAEALIGLEGGWLTTSTHRLAFSLPPVAPRSPPGFGAI